MIGNVFNLIEVRVLLFLKKINLFIKIFKIQFIYKNVAGC